MTLAISLHAPDDELRNSSFPLNRRYPLAEVIDAAREHVLARGRRVTFEYACIDGVNDHPHQAARSSRARLLGLPGGAHVNLIPLNDTAGYAGAPVARCACRRSPRPCGRAASPPPCAATAAPTSTPPAASCGPGC